MGQAAAGWEGRVQGAEGRMQGAQGRTQEGQGRQQTQVTGLQGELFRSQFEREVALKERLHQAQQLRKLKGTSFSTSECEEQQLYSQSDAGNEFEGRRLLRSVSENIPTAGSVCDNVKLESSLTDNKLSTNTYSNEYCSSQSNVSGFSTTLYSASNVGTGNDSGPSPSYFTPNTGSLSLQFCFPQFDQSNTSPNTSPHTSPYHRPVVDNDFRLLTVPLPECRVLSPVNLSQSSLSLNAYLGEGQNAQARSTSTHDMKLTTEVQWEYKKQSDPIQSSLQTESLPNLWPQEPDNTCTPPTYAELRPVQDSPLHIRRSNVPSEPSSSASADWCGTTPSLVISDTILNPVQRTASGIDFTDSMSPPVVTVTPPAASSTGSSSPPLSEILWSSDYGKNL